MQLVQQWVRPVEYRCHERDAEEAALVGRHYVLRRYGETGLFKKVPMRFFLTLIVAVLPSLAQAVCTGEHYEDRLSQAELAELDQRVADMPYSDGLIWQASKGQKKITLVGTVHIYDPRLDLVASRVEPALDEASLLMVEATDDDQASVQRYLLTTPDLAFYHSGPTLPDRLEESDWIAVRDAAGERGVPSAMAAKMRPWMLMMTLAIPSCAFADQLAGLQGLDHMLMDSAEERGLPVEAIEDWRTVVDLLTVGTEDEHIKGLLANLQMKEESAELANSLVASYFMGQPMRGWELGRFQSRKMPGFTAEEGEAEFDDLAKRLLDDRNTKWIPAIATALEMHDNIVIAVGAAHLPGNMGVLTLLEAEGWEISPR